MKSLIKNKFPKLYGKVKSTAIKAVERPIKKIFKQKYENKEWGMHDSVSGPGSLLESTENIRKELPLFLKKYNIHSILDAACGDFNWMSVCAIKTEKFTGIDIVEDLTEQNSAKYGTQNRKFFTLDITKDPLPKADLILCRDAFVHFSFKNIIRSVRNFKQSGSGYLLTTSFSLADVNEDIFTGGWRTLNLTRAPFNFSEPVDSISDIVPDFENEFKGKILGLWKLSEIHNC